MVNNGEHANIAWKIVKVTFRPNPVWDVWGGQKWPTSIVLPAKSRWPYSKTIWSENSQLWISKQHDTQTTWVCMMTCIAFIYVGSQHHQIIYSWWWPAFPSDPPGGFHPEATAAAPAEPDFCLDADPLLSTPGPEKPEREKRSLADMDGW